MTPALAFLRAHWRPFAAGGAIALAFLFGRASAPARTVERVQEKVVYQDRAVVIHEAAEVHVQEHVVYRDRTVIKRVDGTVVQRDIERTDTGTSSARATAQTEERTVYRDREVVREKVVESRLDWAVHALVGTPISLKPLGLGPVVYGAAVERRVLGPISVGAWGLSSGQGGVSLGLVF